MSPTAELCDLLRALARTEHSDFLLAADAADVIASQAERIVELTEALRELVALKDLKENAALFGPGTDRRSARTEYERRQPLAWDRARALVPAPINPIEHEQTR